MGEWEEWRLVVVVGEVVAGWRGVRLGLDVVVWRHLMGLGTDDDMLGRR
jgi:hypothetical protein